MRRLLLLLALLMALVACGGATTSGCPNPAKFDNPKCAFDNPATLFGP